MTKALALFLTYLARVSLHSPQVVYLIPWHDARTVSAVPTERVFSTDVERSSTHSDGSYIDDYENDASNGSDSMVSQTVSKTLTLRAKSVNSHPNL